MGTGAEIQMEDAGSRLERLPVALVAGHSGSGKTTLIERLVPRLIAGGLRVAVVKHDAHGLNLDHPGKDSDRFFRAGAAVLAGGPGETFLRMPGTWDLEDAARRLLRSNDLVLVEGHKNTRGPVKIWLRGGGEDAPPPEAGDAVMCLGRNEPRVAIVHRFLLEWLARQWLRTPVRAGVLIGGKSSRMGSPKHLLRHGGKSWAARVAAAFAGHADSIVLLGAGDAPPDLGECPRLPDAPGCAGPIAGMRAAMRWDPDASWIFAPCDMPLLTPETVAWMLARRKPGRWAVLPRQSRQEPAEPLFAWYDFRAAELMEKVFAPSELAGWSRSHTALLPGALGRALKNMNTPHDAEGLSGAQDGRNTPAAAAGGF